MKILFDQGDIYRIVKSISDDVSKLITTHQMDCPIFMCVLDGSFRFYSDLISWLNDRHPIVCDFIKVTSYDKKEQIDFKIYKYPKYPIDGKDIIIIDDIYDTGNTMNYIIDLFQQYRPKTISVVTLLHRKGQSNLESKVLKYITGYTINDEWVAGYGMDDFEGTSRNLNYIYELDKKS